MDLEWSEMQEHKLTMQTHNLHFFPPIHPTKKDENGGSVLVWEDDIREKVGWVSNQDKN